MLPFDRDRAGFRRVPPSSLTASATCSRPPDVATRPTTRALCELRITSGVWSRCLRFRPCNAWPSPSTIRRLRRVSSSRSPPSVLRSVRPLPTGAEAPVIGPLVPSRESRSVRVVSLHLDGFLRSDGASIVAARCRPWGSSRFPHSPACPCDSRKSHRSARPTSFPTMHSPREDAPHPQRGSLLTAPSEDVAITQGRSLHDVSREAPLPRRLAQRRRASQWRLLPSCSTSRCCSAGGFLTAVHRFQ
jgi:hypothetical protein